MYESAPTKSVQAALATIANSKEDTKNVNRQELAILDQKKKHKKVCKKLRQMYVREKRKIINKCKQNHDIFCSKSPEAIAQIYRNKDMMGAGARTFRKSRSRSGTIRGELLKLPLLEIKDKLKKQRCR